MKPEAWKAVSYAHRGELLRSKSGIWNFAWAVGEDYLVSRTAAGLLSTRFIPGKGGASGSITHQWYPAPQRGAARAA